MNVIDALLRAKSLEWLDEDGDVLEPEFLPGLSEERLNEIETEIGALLPSDYRELALACGGIDGPLAEIDFGGLFHGGLTDSIFPEAIAFASDGFGNDWIVDLPAEREPLAQIYFVSHDAPIVLYQGEGMAAFLDALTRMYEPPYASAIDDVHEDRIFDVWRRNPGTIDQAAAQRSDDPELRAFAVELDPSFVLIDLRSVPIGMGFSWGRHGPKTRLRRFGDQRIFAYAPPEKG